MTRERTTTVAEPPQLASARRVLRDVFGYSEFRPGQAEVITAVLQGRDTLAVMPTGGGKSVCYQVPALLENEGITLVVSPLLALMKDQVDALHAMGVAAAAINSSISIEDQRRTLAEAAEGRLQLLYVAPERFGNGSFVAALRGIRVALLAIDEAHCISQWGHDFRPSYRELGGVRQLVGNPPVVALTATADPRVREDILLRLQLRDPVVHVAGFDRPNLRFEVQRVSSLKEKSQAIAGELRALKQESAIVYCGTRKRVEEVTDFLQRSGVKCARYHAGMEDNDRKRIQDAFARDTLRVIVATNAFGMGIDKADVRCVVHLEPPPDMESYYQEAGRAGRDGRPAYAFLLAHPSDERKMHEKFEASFPSLAEVRRVYQALADQHQVALGAGLFEAYGLDLSKLAARTTLPVGKVHSALKALELDGTLALSDGARTPSRVMMRASGDDVHHLRIADQRRGPVLEALLRMYGGLFEEPSIIDEERIAQQTARSVVQVRQMLRELERDHVLFYHPRSDAPQVTLLVPRRDAQTLTLDPQALQLRKQRAWDRLEAMARYAFHDEGCRAQAVMRYFGQALPDRCGRCDNCKALERADRTAEPPARWLVDEGRVATRPHNGT